MASEDPPMAKRRRRRAATAPQRFGSEEFAEDDRLMRIALANSRAETKRADLHAPLPEAPVFHPSEEEFRDPVAYLSAIREVAGHAGIARVVPPASWTPDFAFAGLSNPMRFKTRTQRLSTLTQAKAFKDGRKYNCAEYWSMANALKERVARERFGGRAAEDVSEVEWEELYWHAVQDESEQLVVEYGNDIDTSSYGSGFDSAREQPPAVRDSGWNLRNLPNARGSLLSHFEGEINGVNVPWLYFGMLFSTFCWHVEDQFLYSLNYLHAGSPKQWYGIGSPHAAQFEAVAKAKVALLFEDNPDLLHHLVAMFPPAELVARKVPVYQTVQRAGEFIVTFPEGYHAGFSYGWNCGEAVNVAAVDWVPFGFKSADSYQRVGRQSVFSLERMLLTMVHCVTQYVDQLELVAAYVGRAVEEERALREGLRAVGISRAARIKVGISGRIDEAALQGDERRQCCVCERISLLSSVSCSCSTQVSCLLHLHDACQCAVENKVLVFAYTMQDLNLVLERLQAAVRARNAVRAEQGSRREQIEAVAAAMRP